MLHLTDCELPCWIGIVPGKTTVREARTLVEKTYSGFIVREENGDVSQLTITDTTNSFRIGIKFNSWTEIQESNTNIQVIELWTDNSLAGGINYGYFHSLYGQPEYVVLPAQRNNAIPGMIYGNYRVRVGYPEYSLDLVSKCPSINMGQSIGGLKIWNTMPLVDNGYIPFAWNGFSACYLSE